MPAVPLADSEWDRPRYNRSAHDGPIGAGADDDEAGAFGKIPPSMSDSVCELSIASPVNAGARCRLYVEFH